MKFGARPLTSALFLAVALKASAAVLYVDVNGATPSPPYTNWATAARVIQDAVDAASAGDEIVVTNGTYATGGRTAFGFVVNRVAVRTPLNVRSVNGPQFTFIQAYPVPITTNGAPPMRCVSLTNGASLFGFTLSNGLTTNTVAPDGDGSGAGVSGDYYSGGYVANCVLSSNSASGSGGGAHGVTMSNCVLTGNSAYTGGGAGVSELQNCTVVSNSASGGGGGAISCSLNGCIITANWAGVGGGAAYSNLRNCTVVANSAGAGGGISFFGDSKGASFAYNCIIYSNTAPSFPNYATPFLYYCCTTPDPGALGPWPNGNITNAPLFVDPANGDFHLQPNCACINAGNNAYVTTATDLDGNPRISGGTVDIGAYEFQNPASIISYAWLQEYGLPTDGSGDFTDPDGDGMNNWKEWRCGTNPTNALSFLGMLPPSPGSNSLGITVNWMSVGGITYYLQRSTNLATQPLFSTIQSNILGQAITTSYEDTNAAGAGPFLYRVGVQ